MTIPVHAIKIFSDGATLKTIAEHAKSELISGFTTNPTLMRKAGITNYRSFVQEALSLTDKPISFEVIADDPQEMIRQGRILAAEGENVYVKIPIMTTTGKSTALVIHTLANDGIKINVTAITTVAQALTARRYLCDGVPAIISVFAGRIADTGKDPLQFFVEVRKQAMWYGDYGEQSYKSHQLLWASPREIFNVQQAIQAGCHIITLTPEMFDKFKNWGKDLTVMSLDTVRMFYNDAKASGLEL